MTVIKRSKYKVFKIMIRDDSKSDFIEFYTIRKRKKNNLFAQIIDENKKPIHFATRQEAELFLVQRM